MEITQEMINDLSKFDLKHYLRTGQYLITVKTQKQLEAEEQVVELPVETVEPVVEEPVEPVVELPVEPVVVLPVVVEPVVELPVVEEPVVEDKILTKNELQMKNHLETINKLKNK